MRGTIIRREKRWSVVIDVGRDPETGKRVRRWFSGFESKRAAEEARVEILARLQRGLFIEPSKQTFGEYLLREWLPSREAKLEPNSAETEV